ncbi:MAG: DUF1570 domain-containing protein [Phycisphaerae bacterium]|nr:DUF1570 domain-containing protein [Phycisphaerae bacterium]
MLAMLLGVSSGLVCPVRAWGGGDDPPKKRDEKKSRSDEARGRKTEKKSAKKRRNRKRRPQADLSPLPPNSEDEKRWRDDVGSGFELVRTEHFAILHDTSPEAVRDFGETLERTYRSCQTYTAEVGLKAKKPEKKLLVIYFSGQADHRDYLEKLGKERLAPLEYGAYYHDLGVGIFFDFHNTDSRRKAGHGQANDPRSRLLGKRAQEIGDKRDVLVIQREASLQVVWNNGFLNSRVPTANPRWLVEGTSAMFARIRAGESKKYGIIEDSTRFQRFRSLEKQQKLLPLQDLISSPATVAGPANDDRGVASTQSWALVHYLKNARRKSLGRYLTLINERTEGYESSPERELATFEKAFGELDSKWTNRWLKWMKKAAQTRP